MAKEQKRGNREIRKPKKVKKEPAAPPAPFQGISEGIGTPKKKS
ncbi:hypothetical protein GALL_279640 [mine drainage metagenome]|uniref:Uncharacterized protein n=1 Tax=mine drainage metagenome TaxID=410659 RepID=A0A1J5RDG8_9ZZZZ